MAPATRTLTVTSSPVPTGSWRRPAGLAALAGLVATLVWSYAPSLAGMAERWATDPQYSHGYLVPLFAAVLLWLRRDRLAGAAWGPRAWGVLFLAAGTALRLAGTCVYLEWLERASLLPCLAGVCLLAGGGPALRWAWPAVVYLLFMVPLPFRVQTAMAGPLQRVATVASTFILQTTGIPAVAEGNIIVVDDTRLGVEEACSGLTMLVTFLALSTAVALVVRRAWLDKALVVAAAAPIAILSNVARITATGVLTRAVSPEFAQAVFHDYAGWLMMPFALGLLGALLWGLDRLLLPPEEDAPVAADFLRHAGARLRPQAHAKSSV